MITHKPPRPVRRIFILSLKICACILAILVLAEIILRVSFYYQSTPAEKAYIEYGQGMRSRLLQGWLDIHTVDPFAPPLLVFSDKDWSDQSRLNTIFEATTLPPSQTWTSHDFLQSQDKAMLTAYTVHSNALGFRGPEYSAQKPKGTYRIIVLGSYQAFGFDVNDDQTYPALLQKKLSDDMPGRKFEVWNGGRYAGTAIVGLARMRKDIFDYQPDLIVIDYGYIDGAVFGDNIMPIALRFPDTMPYQIVRGALHPFADILGHSFLVDHILKKILLYSYALRVRDFGNTMQAMLSLADSHHVPVILVREEGGMLSFPPVITNRAVGYVEAEKLFKTHPLAPLTPSDAADPYWKRTWVADLPVAALKTNPDYLYYQNYLQINSVAYGLIANALAGDIEGILSKRP